MRALQGDPALRRHGSHDVDPFAERRRHPRVRTAQAGVSHLRQHADDARIDWFDDGPGSGDDVGMRRLRRQHHLRQYFAEASDQRQARRVRTAACARSVPEVPTVPEVPEVPGAQSAITLPRAPEKSPPEAISNDALTSRIDKFLASRGLAPAAHPRHLRHPKHLVATAQPEKFVCEDDVRQAVKDGRKLLIGERTIVTPAARDAGEAAKVFVHAGWPSP